MLWAVSCKVGVICKIKFFIDILPQKALSLCNSARTYIYLDPAPPLSLGCDMLEVWAKELEKRSLLKGVVHMGCGSSRGNRVLCLRPQVLVERHFSFGTLLNILLPGMAQKNQWISVSIHRLAPD